MAASPIDWMMLDPFVFRRDGGSFPNGETTPFRAEGSSSHGGPFTVAFRLVEPPGISRFYLQWPGGPKEGSSCDLVSVHRNLLLFRLTSNPIKGKGESLIWPQEYFICEGGPSPPLQLHEIPKCTRSLHLRSVGIVSGLEEKYVIAQLCLSESNLPARMEAELCVLRSNKWKLLQNLRIKHKAHELSDLIHWRTDKVICFQNSLCWVSYFSGGILFCDVLNKRPKVSYLRLPVPEQCRSTDYHRLQDMNSSLCITDSGMKLMFVCVIPEDDNIVGPIPPYTDFVVTCHTLGTLDTDESRWEKVFIIKSSELWDLNASLPQNALTFPLVSVTKSNELYFLLSEEEEHGIDKVSVIAFDTISNTLAIHQYIKGVTDLSGEDDDMVRQKLHLIHPFVPIEFPRSLGLTS